MWHVGRNLNYNIRPSKSDLPPLIIIDFSIFDLNAADQPQAQKDAQYFHDH